MEDVVEGKAFSFPAEEEKILKFWKDIDAFKQQLKQTEGKKEFVFFDGPPFATGLPHYGHILAGTLKDIVTRYASQTGHHVVRRFGWDCHGLPVEYEIDKKLGITCPDDVIKMGIDKYNEECRSIVMRYAGEWETTITRLGRWIDFENDYKTLDPSFMESVWWVFGQLWEKDLVYRGFKVMPYSTACATTLSNFEAGLNYKDVSDPAVMVSFPLLDDPDSASMVAWTTTPWTLPSNLALCVNPNFVYVKLQDPKNGKVYIVAEGRISFLPGAVAKKKKGKAKEGAAPEAEGFKVIASMKGSELKGLRYEPLFQYFVPQYKDTAWRVCADTYVTDDSGTGVVHQAPAFGEDDYRVCMAHGIVAKGDVVPCPVDAAGCFTPEITDFAGQHVKEADKGLIAAIKVTGRLYDSASLVHSYPFCWRSDTPLIYKAVPSWFVKVEQIRDQLLANNEQTSWVPTYVKEKRFHNWLENARDWAVSRSRFWGTPIPIWVSDDFEERIVIDSVAKLEELTGEKVTDLHSHKIDHLLIPSVKNPGTMLKRIPDVFDCWFESGSMPYAQCHYPFENKDHFEANFPADFIAEGLDQTRGWFYTLMVLSTALFNKPAFKNLVCNGLVLASDGKKMSKRLKNYPDPTIITDKYGADALRLYLINSPVVRAEPLRFEEKGVFGVVKDVFLPWYNAYRFLAQNIVRMRTETGVEFSPQAVDLTTATNVMDRWIQAATRELVNTVREQMDLYHLYNVVPFLVKFIDDLTNIYVRYNRRRLKGRDGPEDCALALATLFDTLHKVNSVMSPFTPFLTETMYQNMRRVLGPDAPQSIHFLDIPAVVPTQSGDAQIQASVHRMQKVIDLGRVIRERHQRPTKTPLRCLTVAHDDAAFISDLSGPLASYVKEELNVAELRTAHPDEYGVLVAEPNWAALGARFGKQMGPVSKAIKGLGPADIRTLRSEGSLEVAGHQLTTSEIVVKTNFQAPPGMNYPEDADAHGDGEVMVVLDLRKDESLQAQGTAREVVNRFQKLRKHAGLQVGDAVDMFYTLPDGDPASQELQAVIEGESAYLRDNLGMDVRPGSEQTADCVVIASQEQSVVLSDDLNAAFTATLTVPATSSLAALAALTVSPAVVAAAESEMA